MLAKTRELLQKVIDVYGKEYQMRIAQEELAELIIVISKAIRRPGNKYYKKDLVEEIVDVELILEQLKLTVDQEALVIERTMKLCHLEEKLAKRKNPD